MRVIWGRAARLRGTAVALAALVTALAAAPATASSPFDPGGPPRLAETLPIQVVLIGYGPELVPEPALKAALPSGSRPIVRSRAIFGGGTREDVGLELVFNYKIVHAGDAYEDAFFAHLHALSRPESEVTGLPRTRFQTRYNEQSTNVLDIESNWVISATDVERWLVEHPAPGVDPRRNTLVLINWWGRSDFRFHTYEKRGEPDLDTGVDFGESSYYGRLSGWGGTGAHDEETGFGRESRVWFYDLSAGPDGQTVNWLVDRDDITGDGVADRRLWPVWEYLVPGGKRPATALAGDLAALARYVAVDLLFAPSPLYPPYLRPHRLPDRLELDLTVYDDVGRPVLRVPEVVHEVAELVDVPVVADVEVTRFTGETRECYRAWIEARRCRQQMDADHYPSSWANLFLSQAMAIEKWRDGSAEHELGGFTYAAREHHPSLVLGFADNNWLDGTQSGVFAFPSGPAQEAGFGATYTMIHEVGHHLGVSHPHDGFDSEAGVRISPTGRFFFVWAGDAVNSVMSYHHVNRDFSQFDLDNIRRWRAAAYLRSANAIAADVLASDRAAAGADELDGARAAFADAQTALAAHDYGATVARARDGYALVREAAAEAEVPVPATDDGWRLLPPGQREGHQQLGPMPGAVDTLEGVEGRRRLAEGGS